MYIIHELYMYIYVFSLIGKESQEVKGKLLLRIYNQTNLV